MDKLKCLKCGYSWWPRSEDKPRLCPACKCRKWESYKEKGDGKVHRRDGK